MKYLILLFLLLPLTLFGQDSLVIKDTLTKQSIKNYVLTEHPKLSCKVNWDNGVRWHKSTPLKRIIWTQVAVVGYGIFDYIGYNTMKSSSTIDLYRVGQGIALSGINYLLADNLGLSSAVAFDIQAITAVPDMVYYGIDGVSKGFGGFSGGNEFNSKFQHLNFTPWYHLNGGRMSKTDVTVQALLGLNFSILINL